MKLKELSYTKCGITLTAEVTDCDNINYCFSVLRENIEHIISYDQTLPRTTSKYKTIPVLQT